MQFIELLHLALQVILKLNIAAGLLEAELIFRIIVDGSIGGSDHVLGSEGQRF
jgi:hypothetical protein